ITRAAARETLMERYFAAVGVATAADARKLFQWRPRDVTRALSGLVERDLLRELPGATPSKTRYLWCEVTADG
ncbi:MAG: DNA glycosylase AlkZ-like family protein, partial [Chloroflexota bacterium]